MKTSVSILLSAALIAGVGSAQASVVTFTHDYGKDKYDPGGNDPLGADFVEVRDYSSKRFRDSFDLSSLVMDNNTVFELTLDYTGTDQWFEDWDVRIQGDDPSSAWDDEFFYLDGTAVFTLDKNSDSRFENAFTTTIANQTFEFWFWESWKVRDNKFELKSATLKVSGVSQVPLPAAAWLFGSALVGIAGLGYRRSRQA